MTDSLSGDVTVAIQDVGFGGQGVGRLPDGRVVFVPRTLCGETVRARPLKAGKNFAEAELIEVLQPSPHRVAAPCRYFPSCGGCAYQHATYEEQLRMKKKQVHDLLARIGGIKVPPDLHVEAAPRVHGYRNKIVVHQGDGGELGFYAIDKRRIVDIEECWISTKEVNRKLADLRKRQRRPRHASLLDSGEREGAGEGSFHQVNTEMARRLRDWIRARETECEGRPSSLLELYCGAGFFALGLADCFESVSGADRDERAIHAAVAQARSRGIAHARFLAADVSERIRWLLEPHASRPLAVLVDPPREGLPRNVADALAETRNLRRLIYVSCNPSTLARDLKILLPPRDAVNFGLSHLGLFDMFPQTAHIETVAVLNRK